VPANERAVDVSRTRPEARVLVDPLLGVSREQNLLPATSSQLPATCDCRSSSANTLTASARRAYVSGQATRTPSRVRYRICQRPDSRLRIEPKYRGWSSAKPPAPSPHLCDQRRVGPSQRLLDLGERIEVRRVEADELPRRAPRAGRALSDFGGASTAALLRNVVKHGQVARDLRTDLDASAAALALLDTYLGTLYRWGPVAATCGSKFCRP
jgi:hypothetical protein